MHVKQCEPQRIKGWFYLPEASDDRVPGILSWEPGDGATLELIGGFSPRPECKSMADSADVYTDELISDVRAGTVYGESDSGKKLSVWDAQRRNITTNMTGQVREEFWSSSWVCVGAHIQDPQESAFSSAVIVPDDLYYLTDDGRFAAPRWATIDGVDRPGETLDNGTLLTPYVIPVVGGYRADYAVGEVEVTRYSVCTAATRPWISNATEAMPDLKLDMMTRKSRRGPVIELRVSAKVRIMGSQNQTRSAADFIDRCAPVIDLMRMATFGPCGVETIEMTSTTGEHVVILSRAGEPAKPDEMHRPGSVVFGLADVTFESYLQVRQTLTKERQGTYAWSVLVGLCGYTSRYVEEFVSQAVAAAEGFERWCLDGGSEDTLNTRLKNLHNMLPSEVQTLIGLNVEHWAQWAVWARNHVAHGGTTRRRIVEDSAQLFAIAETVHLVTYLVAVQQLGVPVEKMMEALTNHPRLRVLATKSEVVNEINGLV